MKSTNLIMLAAVTAVFASCQSKSMYNKEIITSPDEKLCVTVETNKGQLYYSAKNDERIIVAKSKLGFVFKNMPQLGNQVEIIGSQRNSSTRCGVSRAQSGTRACRLG